jgi:hypothetical protein
MALCRSEARESRPISFPAHQLLVLEERLREREEAGELPPEMDPTDFALRLLVAAELVSHSRRFPTRLEPGL